MNTNPESMTLAVHGSHGQIATARPASDKRSLWQGVAAFALLVATTVLPATAYGNPDHELGMRFDGYAQQEGLSQNTVLSILQDSTGHMWFATENGLNRFDGYEFKVYQRQALNPGALTSDFIFAVDEDAEGNLWIATDGGGIAVLGRETGNFDFLRHDPEDAGSLASNNIRALSIASDGSVWIGHQRAGLDRLEPVSGRITHFRHDPAVEATLSSDEIYAISVDADGAVWVGTDSGLNRVDPASGLVTRYRHSDEMSLADDQVRTVYTDSNGNVWVGTKGGGLDRLDPETGAFTHFRYDPENHHSLANNRVWSIVEDDAGRLWVGTSNGLSMLEPGTSRFEHHRHDPTDPNSLGDNVIRSLHVDNSGLLWVGTQAAGVFRWNPRSWAFGHVRPRASGAASAVSNVLSFTVASDGTVYVGTFGDGLQVVDGKSGAISHYRHDPENPAGLSDDRVMSLAAGRDGKVWVGTMTAGVSRLDPATGTFEHFRHDAGDPTSISANGIMALFEDREGRLWAGTFGGGVSRLDPGASGFVRFVQDPANPNSLSAMRATAFAQDMTGAVWIGTDGGGLNRWDPVTNAFQVFRHDPLDPGSVSADTIYSLHVDARGAVWVGTRGAGLDQVLASSRFPGTFRFRNFSQADGLANDVIYGIHSDANGLLWLSTNFGLSRLDPASGEVRNFHASHGLQGEEFNFGAHFRSESGELFFGGSNGFNRFRPEALQINQQPPRVVLSGLKILNEPAQTEAPLPLLSDLSLGFRDHVVQFRFAALDYADPAQNRYQYMLEGFDADWVKSGRQRSATYTNLAAGDYTFRVRGANSDGIWSEDELRLAVHVAPPPWKTGWAYALYAAAALLVLALIVLALRRRAQRKEAYRIELERQVAERTRELASRNDELHSLNSQLAEASLTDPLTGLRNRRYLYEEASKDVDLVRRHYEDSKDGTKKPLTTDLVFLMIDLDHFKPINDTHGHSAGDEVLLQVRDTLKRAARSSDQIIRWGGDEFLVVARHTDADEAEQLAERIRRRIAERVIVLGDGQVVRTTCSVGFACYPFLRQQAGRLAWEQVMAIADRAMYMAKETRNAWVGLIGTAKSAEAAELFDDIQDDPDTMIESGELEIRTSVPRHLAHSA